MWEKPREEKILKKKRSTNTTRWDNERGLGSVYQVTSARALVAEVVEVWRPGLEVGSGEQVRKQTQKLEVMLV